MIKTGRKLPSCALQTHRRAQMEAALKTQQCFSHNKSFARLRSSESGSLGFHYSSSQTLARSEFANIPVKRVFWCFLPRFAVSH